MPIPVLRARSAVFGFALAALMFASVAEAKTTPGDLLIVNSGGRTLADQTQYTDTARIKTDTKADCFGPDTGGSGDVATVPGATALGLIADAGTTEPRLDPLSVTDSFAFGLGLCGIGKAVAPTTGFWYLKVNHSASQLGGDQTPVRRGDEILWYLIDDFNDPVPDELVLSAPAKVKPGADIPVKVVAYADDGKRTRAEGVRVAGADDLTGADGTTTVAADSRLVALTGTRDGSISSGTEIVCTVAVDRCPPGYGETVAGTGGADKIIAGKAAETILAGGGDDTINATRGTLADAINCGGGKDRVTLSAIGFQRSKVKGCETTIAPASPNG